jgi:hypothetical protein
MTDSTLPTGSVDELDAAPPSRDPSHDATAELALPTAPAQGPEADDGPRMARAIVESIVLTVAFPAVGYAFDRGDPFLLKHAFPWIVFAPLLVGLRHGFAPGCTSALLLAGALVLSWRAHALGVVAFPAESAVGLVALAMLTGQFSDVWRRETRRLATTAEQLRRRGAALAQSHFLLDLSHERLRQDSAGVPDLQDALAGVRRAAAAADGSWASIADAMMSIFAAYAMLEVGVVVRLDARGHAAGTIAAIGAVQRVDPDDALLVAAVRSRDLVYQPSKGSASEAGPWSRLLAAIPFVDTQGGVSAVLCVQSMPFAAFHKKNLEALFVLAGHFADLIATGGPRADDDEARRREFDTRLARAIHDHQSFGLPSVVIELWMRRGAQTAALGDLVLGAIPADVDAVMRTRDGFENVVVLALVPMAAEELRATVPARVEAAARRELGSSLSEAGAALSFHAVGANETFAAVMRTAMRKTRTS